MNLDALMSSKKKDWRTPNLLYHELDKIFNFDFDPCPINPDFDGLDCEWGDRNFVNPPYGTEIKRWIEKGFEQASQGKMVVFLIPARTDTQYWHDYIMKATEIWLIKGRLKFSDCRTSAPFPSAIVIFMSKKREGVLEVKSVNTIGEFI